MQMSVQGMMKAKGYGNFDAHKKMHDDFVDKVKGLAAPVSADTVHFAKDWSVHILLYCELWRK